MLAAKSAADAGEPRANVALLRAVESELFHCAISLMDCHGEDACDEAQERAHDLLVDGDPAGHRRWLAIARVVEQLQGRAH